MSIVVHSTVRVNSAPETYDAYFKRLDKTQKRLGEGFSAQVFQHPTLPNVAVRVSPTRNASNEWFKLALKMGGRNPWMPKVFEIETRALSSKKNPNAKLSATFVFMEKLRPLSRQTYAILVKTNPTVDVVDSLSAHEGKTLSLPLRGNVRSQVMDTLDDVHDPMARQALTLALKGPPGGSCLLDLHEGNFMMRGDQYVLIDPWNPNR